MTDNVVLEIYPHSQKSRSDQNGIYWPDFLKDSDLKEISLFVTEQSKFNTNFLNESSFIEYGGKKYSYNVGNVIKVKYRDSISYVTLGIPKNDGRNSYFQQIAPAYSQFLKEENIYKNFYFYALPIDREQKDYGKIYTLYHHFMYSLLSTCGIEANWKDFLDNTPLKFKKVEEIISRRNRLNKENNNSSYAYFDNSIDTYNLFLKTYGASKYESFFMTFATINTLDNLKLKVYELEEGNLNQLPLWCINFLKEISENNQLFETLDTEMDEHRVKELSFPPKLRTPRHRKNVFEKFGSEKCLLCDENIAENIQAAHIWEVKDIKKLSKENSKNEDLWEYTADGNNGIWLCSFHHRNFDQNKITFDLKGDLLYSTEISAFVINKIKIRTKYFNFQNIFSDPNTAFYLRKRLEHLNLHSFLKY